MHSNLYLLVPSLLGAVAAAASSYDTSSYIVNRIPLAHTKRAVSPETVTNHVLYISRAKGATYSSQVLSRYLDFGQQGLVDADLGEEFLTEIAFGNETFEVIVDTGSSDTWLVEDGFTCVDIDTNATIPEAECYFGPLYTPSSTFQLIPDENFNITYADGEYLNGIMGYETVTIAGITVPKQEVGVVNLAGWDGDGISSGLMGLAYPNITSAYAGTNASADVGVDNLDYSPLFTTMYTTGLVEPLFSLALSRDESGTGDGGVIAIGGIPSNISYTGSFASTPIEVLQVCEFDCGVSEFQFYTIAIDGLSYASQASKSKRHQPHDISRRAPISTSTPPKSSNVTLVDVDVQFIVDSGTTLNYIPTKAAAKFNALFDPPAFFDDNVIEGYYLVDCNATAPTFDVYIGGEKFGTNPYDLVLDIEDGNVCLSGIQDGGELGESVYILGDVFLKNVLAVFDVGAAELRFAAREYYSS